MTLLTIAISSALIISNTADNYAKKYEKVKEQPQQNAFSETKKDLVKAFNTFLQKHPEATKESLKAAIETYFSSRDSREIRKAVKKITEFANKDKIVFTSLREEGQPSAMVSIDQPLAEALTAFMDAKAELRQKRADEETLPEDQKIFSAYKKTKKDFRGAVIVLKDNSYTLEQIERDINVSSELTDTQKKKTIKKANDAFNKVVTTKWKEKKIAQFQERYPQWFETKI